VADAALQALGAVFITQPDFMLDEQPKAVVRAALHPAAPPLLKTRVLLNLTELLKVQPGRRAGMTGAATRAKVLHASHHRQAPQTILTVLPAAFAISSHSPLLC
jgi:hypothetical protein